MCVCVCVCVCVCMCVCVCVDKCVRAGIVCARMLSSRWYLCAFVCECLGVCVCVCVCECVWVWWNVPITIRAMSAETNSERKPAC